MAEEDATFSQLIATWQELQAGDRKAILQAMTVEQRLALEEVLSTEGREETSSASEFFGYSGWLAKILKSGDEAPSVNMGTASPIKPKVCAVLSEIHQALQSESSVGHEPIGIVARIRQFWLDLGVAR